MGFDLSQVDFDALREVDVRTADPDSLVDIKEIITAKGAADGRVCPAGTKPLLF